MSKLTKTELIKTVADKAIFTHAATKEILDATFDTLTTLPVGGSVTIPGFGKFAMKATKAKSGVAPNGKAYDKPAGQKLTFTASSKAA